MGFHLSFNSGGNKILPLRPGWGKEGKGRGEQGSIIEIFLNPSSLGSQNVRQLDG